MQMKLSTDWGNAHNPNKGGEGKEEQTDLSNGAPPRIQIVMTPDFDEHRRSPKKSEEKFITRKRLT